ncbi:hypothetical protein [Shewanella decolorationis]|uniref:hypothetical protein n=1 Tax=Shewanella decolorationis TaxID=256839 RepID=UPI00105759B2|nr:hypothetical protein [Shewanella decolorationis]
MAITKEQWQQLETEMAGLMVNISFSYQGHELTIRRCRDGESKTVLAVFIDSSIDEQWFTQVENLTEDAPKILPEVWCHRTISRYKPKDIAEIEKILGKRKAKKEYPNLHDKLVWLSPYYSKASVLCRQFKKLKGLEVTKADCLALTMNLS